ncbi:MULTISPECIES: hypothetical protein [unclassified Kribbella]|uniref:hypothetical protein n=1 Tax=unclassified Kribbella TaxID=2644121 RepID=UPI00301A0514
MTNTVVHGLPRWSLAVPPLALVVLLLSWGRDLGAVLLILVCAGLGAAVIAAVHHAEVLFALTVVTSMLTLATGRATLLQGAVHLMVFSAFLFLAVSP